MKPEWHGLYSNLPRDKLWIENIKNLKVEEVSGPQGRNCSFQWDEWAVPRSQAVNGNSDPLWDGSFSFAIWACKPVSTWQQIVNSDWLMAQSSCAIWAQALVECLCLLLCLLLLLLFLCLLLWLSYGSDTLPHRLPCDWWHFPGKWIVWWSWFSCYIWGV